MSRSRAAALTLSSALLLVGCGRSAVTDVAPEAPPYEGPLFVEVTAPLTEEDADRSGAAGLVVDCDFPGIGDSRSSPYDGGSVTRSPAAALTEQVAEVHRHRTDGFRKARAEPDRVLYTYEVDRRVKQAYIVHRGPAVDGKTGWYVESWARCDWAEFPPALVEEMGLQVWSDRSGRRVPTSRLVSSAGPEHCDWQDMTFLSLDGGSLDGGQSYVAHPHPELYPDWFRVAYAEGVELPADATDTGYEHDGRHLWLAKDRSRAFVGTEESVDVWPAQTQPLGCA